MTWSMSLLAKDNIGMKGGMPLLAKDGMLLRSAVARPNHERSSAIKIRPRVLSMS